MPSSFAILLCKCFSSELKQQFVTTISMIFDKKRFLYLSVKHSMSSIRIAIYKTDSSFSLIL